MEMKYSFFADAVTLDANQKVNALGIFDNITTQQIPAVHTRAYYVVRIQFHRSEFGPKKVRLNFVNQDGKSVYQTTEFDAVISEGLQNANFIVEYQNIVFESSGSYAIDVSVDGHHIGSTTLSVQLV